MTDYSKNYIEFQKMSLKTKSTDINLQDTSIAFEHISNRNLKKTYYIFALMNLNWLVKIGTFFIKLSLKLGLPIKKIIKNTIFSQFCGGENIVECRKTIDSLAEFNVGTILDYSVEGEDNESDFERTKDEIIRTIEIASKNRDKIPFSVFKVSGIGSVDLLEKQQLGEEPLEEEEKKAFEAIKRRVSEISAKAAELEVRLFFDAEESWIQDTIDSLCYEMMEKFNTAGLVIIYNTYQLYRYDVLDNFKNSVETAQHKGYKVGAKLVRGAYIERERLRASENEYKDPINRTKEETDEHYDAAVDFSLNHLDTVAICLGTHNDESCLKCVKLMDELDINPKDSRIYFAQLLGMSDNISFNLAKSGFNVAKYVPYGPVESVMPYLFRRAAENTSIAGQSSREFLLIKEELRRRYKK